MITIFILWAIFTFVLGVKMAPNDDMVPRVSAGDILLFYRIDKQVDTKDVIVIEKNDTCYVLRVIAAEGDTVDITEESGLVINGKPASEENIYYSTPRYEGFVEYPVTLEKDECFVLADKREGGEDSRYFGPVKIKEIRGTVIGQFRRAGI